MKKKRTEPQRLGDSRFADCASADGERRDRGNRANGLRNTAARNTAARNTAARNTAARNTAARNTAARNTAQASTASTPRRGVIRTLVLYFTVASIGVVLGGPGGGVPEIPVSTFSAGGGSHGAVLPSGEQLTIDYSFGLTMVGSGEGTGGYALFGGFQQMREAVEATSGPVGTPFRRGDANGDGLFNIADAIATLGFLFSGGAMNCADAGDSNDDGLVNIADGITVLGALFSGGGAPPAPGPNSCGVDPTDDALDCETYNSCG